MVDGGDRDSEGDGGGSGGGDDKDGGGGDGHGSGYDSAGGDDDHHIDNGAGPHQFYLLHFPLFIILNFNISSIILFKKRNIGYK